MKTALIRTWPATLIGAVALLLTISSTCVADPAPIQITFWKCAVSPGVWIGEVNGECDSRDLEYNDAVFKDSTPVWQLAGLYTITDGEACYFSKAFCHGVLNSKTGAIVLNGVVTEGPNEGATVHVRATLILTDSGPCSEGVMTITPK